MSDSRVSTLEQFKNPNRRFSIFRTYSDIYKALLLSIIVLSALFLLVKRPTTAMVPSVTIAARRHAREKAVPTSTQPLPSRRLESALTPAKVPFVDRSILQKLADMEIYPDPDERPYFASSPHRPPMVTRIPEPRKPSGPPPPSDICSGAPCRFLFPLRIGEQESKARIHFMELLQLARSLNRILVLPNVGKSRMGACFKLDFKMYYDLERLEEELGMPAGRVATMKVDLFRRWVDAQAPSAQLVFISAKSEPPLDVETTMFSNDDVSIRVGPMDSNMDLPGCFTKFHTLRLTAHAPLHIHLKHSAPTHPIAPSLIDALTRPDIHAAAASSSTQALDPDVLVLTYDLRFPIFPTHAPPLPQLHYAPRLYALAAVLAPPAPYAMVHWRMESVPPAVLPTCAYSLVDTLCARLSAEVRTVWFASDYPRAVHRSGMDSTGTQKPKAKSGTFRDVGPLHAEAVGILGDALVEGGWEVVELTDARLAGLGVEKGEWGAGLLEDAGVRAIVDKIIGMRATVFVSGAPGCARVSSFTRQILDERRAVFDRLRENETELPALQNVVELFG
ncbi:hypothetical protein B0H16DRAFT_1721254 [Mycena metata]|uniref:Proteophosphoglycan 5 n=1 Tax=Mycena metata TaxID=1033252 RepID=A0AAD7J611_9AGAR|nr:hypothetical protein B0H16DRAFT_1721254 [Mycena metata]